MIETERLILRPWKEEDVKPFAELNADPAVMRYFPSTLTEQQTATLIKELMLPIEKFGWGFWAVERRQDGQFLGMTGLRYSPTKLPIPETNPIELAWRYAQAYWGMGYAEEAALACVRYGLNTLLQPSLYAYTAKINQPSQNLMQRIAMNQIGEFDHPQLDPQHVLAPHVLYQI